MTPVVATTVYSVAGDTVDLLCWRYYGRDDNAVVVATLNANPHLADLGVVLPDRTLVNMPDTVPPVRQDIVRLWL